MRLLKDIKANERNAETNVQLGQCIRLAVVRYYWDRIQYCMGGGSTLCPRCGWKRAKCVRKFPIQVKFWRPSDLLPLVPALPLLLSDAWLSLSCICPQFCLQFCRRCVRNATGILAWGVTIWRLKCKLFELNFTVRVLIIYATNQSLSLLDQTRQIWPFNHGRTARLLFSCTLRFRRGNSKCDAWGTFRPTLASTLLENRLFDTFWYLVIRVYDRELVETIAILRFIK